MLRSFCGCLQCATAKTEHENSPAMFFATYALESMKMRCGSGAPVIWDGGFQINFNCNLNPEPVAANRQHDQRAVYMYIDRVAI